MAQPTDRLDKLPPATIVTLLTTLQALRDRVQAGERLHLPEVTFGLASGQSCKGELIAFGQLDNSPDSRTVLLKPKSGGALDATYIPLAAIQTLTVHYAEDNLHLLSFGKLREASGQVPSRLELERELRSLSEQCQLPITIVWDELPKTDEALQGLAILLQQLRDILVSIQAEAIGAEALRELASVAIRVEQNPSVVKRDRVLGILVSISHGDIQFLEKRLLQSAVEQIL
jgi:hypothetical protein